MPSSLRPQVVYHHIKKDMGLPSIALFVISILSIAFALEESAPSSSCTANFLEDKHGLDSSGVHLPLHHIRSPCSPLGLPQPSASDVLNSDDNRVNALLSRLSTNPSHRTSHINASRLANSKAGIPLSPGISYGVGNYITRINLGTPSKSYAVIVDTGSSLSWVQCQPCKLSCYRQQGPTYDPKASSSYSTVSCAAPECNALRAATLNAPGCSLGKVCIYEASYGDSSFSVGYLSKDTLQLGGATLPGFAFGCGQDNEGLFGQTAGLVGLARDRLSMLSQLATRLGNAFSYCLPTASASSGYLSFGGYSPAGYAFTPLVSGSGDSSLYYIKLAAIYVAGKPIPVSAATFASSPTIIDSGTVITRLPLEIYTPFSKAVAGALARYPRAPAYSILDTCFKGSYNRLASLEVSLVFAGGAQLKLSAHNLFYDLDSVGSTCLAFAASSRTTIIGNRQQQTFRVVYDVAGAKIGFSPGGCS